MEQDQIDALNAANQTQATIYTALDETALYKIIGGDWGNNYGHITSQDENLPQVTVELIGQGVSIDAYRDALLAVPFFGA